MKAVHWAATLLAAVWLIPFALSNREPVSLGLWPLPFLVDLPLYLLVLFLLLAGFIIGAVATWIGGRHIRRELRRRRRRLEALERELVAVRSQLEDQADTARSGVPA
jgi:lipopolysaccharide assembly protein A